MIGLDCVAVFENAPDNETRVESINAAAPLCICEAVQVSKHCAEPVAAGETLVRFVLDPTHLQHDIDGTRIKSSFFSETTTIGASTLRLERADAAEYDAALNELIGYGPPATDGSARRLYGVVLIPVSDAKQIQHSIERKDPARTETYDAFGVYATGLPDRPNHADIMMNGTHDTAVTRSKQTRAYKNMAKQVANRLVKISDFTAVDLGRWTQL